MNDSNDEDFNPFAPQADSLEIGRTMDLRQVFERHLRMTMQANQRKRKTIQGKERHIREFEEWWQAQVVHWAAKGKPVKPRAVVADLTAAHLTAYQRSLLKSGKSAKFANASLGVVRQILRCAVKKGLITHAPGFDAIPTQKAAPKVYLTDGHLDSLWQAAELLTWPRKRQGFRPLHYSPAMAWRAALVLYVIYGFRTQELIALEDDATPITWGDIHLQSETPNPAGYTENPWGWVVYTPPKQSWVKDEPLYLPLTVHARAALEHVRPVDWTPEMAVMDWTFSSTSYYQTWHRWCQLAEIKPKVGKRFVPKHLRKTCSTRAKNHREGLSRYITGHASDRSGTNTVSDVSEQHYENAEEFVLEGLTTLPVPECFKEILRRPE